MGRRGLVRSVMLAAIPALAISACSGSSATTAPAAATGTPGAQATPTSAAVTPAPPPVDKVAVRWFVGLGSGTQPAQVNLQSQFVQNYNKTNKDNIYLQMEVVPNANAYDILKTEIAGGNAPDIIGPVGVRGRNGFTGEFLDLNAEIQKQAFPVADYPASMITFFQEGAGKAQIGLPYLIYPAFLWYNKDAFDALSLPTPPTKIGDKYDGKDWTWDTLTELATKLSLDKNDKNPKQSGFDSTKMAQWGIDFQWADGRRMASSWQAGSFLAADGKTAQIPDGWKAAWNWYYNAMWKNFIAPKGKDINSAYLNNTTTTSSGHIAMDVMWGWAVGSLGSKGKTAMNKWNMAVLPSYNGQVSGPLDADTFTIDKSTKNPDQAFKAMVAIMADKGLQQNYGGLPAKTADQKPYETTWETQLKDIWPQNDPINWGVYDEMIQHPANPSHEVDMPNFLKVIDLYTKFYTKLQNTANVDVNAELTKLQGDIQKAFDEAAAK